MIKYQSLYQVSLMLVIFLFSAESYIFGKKLNTGVAQNDLIVQAPVVRVPIIQAPTAPILFKAEWKLPGMMCGSVVFTVNGTNEVVVALSTSMQDNGGMQTEKIVFKPKADSTTYWVSVNKGQDTKAKQGLAGSYVWRWVIKWGKGNVVGKEGLGNKTLSTGGAPYMFRYVGFGGVGVPERLSNIKITDIKN